MAVSITARQQKYYRQVGLVNTNNNKNINNNPPKAWSGLAGW